jgi:hypothetical protein
MTLLVNQHPPTKIQAIEQEQVDEQSLLCPLLKLDRFLIEHTPSHGHLNDIEHLYCANVCSIFFRGPLDRYYE